MPLLVRISAQEYSENGFDLAYGCEVARRFARMRMCWMSAVVAMVHYTLHTLQTSGLSGVFGDCGKTGNLNSL
jgi:hypothetical protein